MANERVEIVPATPEGAEVAAQLLHMTMRPLTEYWMGVDDTRAALGALKRLFSQKHNLFSHEFAEYARVDGNVAGLVLDYPGRTMKELEPPTVLQFLAAAGLVNTIRMVARSFPLQGIAEAGPDEYFLAHIAVLPGYEGGGLGRRLLQRAEQRARLGGFHTITLTVDADNKRAMELYARAGWEVRTTVEIKNLKRRLNYHGYHHMAKTLA